MRKHVRATNDFRSNRKLHERLDLFDRQILIIILKDDKHTKAKIPSEEMIKI
eukprot:CAMPEP_0118685332 /NCGR_PEP_ID=MMETSP0800-20121206/7178_1 /TAXON_ID=210618 ORGANISM="Striatella unipunctata, Strain CCMP2910" /NCGR_SAMPLE_ID=MMETSP0800 /ASSEMBLY_ACC=CAM_ASM_000638 /LENGTH=51 /DNA_ID=CAMNT_0006582213 /DNA_START=516 /DNA_END=671 /DNA_ORIENTATION=+